MKHRKPFLISLVLHLVELAVIFILLFGLRWFWPRYIGRGETIRDLAKEITWQKYRAEKAHKQIPDFQELQYLVTVMETRDQNLFAVAKAAWKYGRQYQVNPYLILSVAHRESNFNPMAISFNWDGSPCAYGIMQIHAAVWKPDMARVFDIDYNVETGTKILKIYLDKNPGDIGAALFHYWGGALANGSYTYPPRVLGSKYYDWRPK